MAYALSMTDPVEPRLVLQSYACALAAAAAAGASIVAAKAVDPALPRPVMLAWLFLCAAALLAAAHLPRAGAVRPHWPPGTLGLLAVHLAFTAGAVLALYQGLLTLDPAMASFLGRTEVLFTVLLAVLVLGERFNLREAFGGLVAVGGLVVINRAALAATGSVPPGFWVTLLGMGLMGFAEVANKRLAPRMPAHTLACVRALCLALVFLALSLTLAGHVGPPRTVDLALIALVALLAPVLARTLYIRSIRVLDLSKVAVLMLLQPLFAALVAWVFLGTLPTHVEGLGGLILLVGCGLLVRARSRTAGRTGHDVRAPKR